MKIYFRHYSGAITEYDYLFFDCMAEVPLDEEERALQEGWLPDDYFAPKNAVKSHWYQARQTRIDLSKDIVVKYTKANKANIEILKDIFNKYFEYRNFKPWKLEPLLSLEIERKHFLIYYLNDEPIAFTFLRDVGENSVFSTQFAWNYENPKLYLGKYANLAEIDYCIANNKDYMYTGVGYEKACIYKSDYQGFQFWNGEAWSNNTEDYKWLCERDSKIEKTKDLDKIKRYDDKNFFIND
jgi:hypothetical protein